MLSWDCLSEAFSLSCPGGSGGDTSVVGVGDWGTTNTQSAIGDTTGLRDGVVSCRCSNGWRKYMSGSGHGMGRHKVRVLPMPCVSCGMPPIPETLEIGHEGARSGRQPEGEAARVPGLMRGSRHGELRLAHYSPSPKGYPLANR